MRMKRGGVEEDKRTRRRGCIPDEGCGTKGIGDFELPDSSNQLCESSIEES